jgi:hypothetical protein
MGYPFYGVYLYNTTYVYYGPDGVTSTLSGNLYYHINSDPTIYTFYWTIPEELIDPNVENIDWKVQISESPTFETYREYTKNTPGIVYHNQGPVRGFDIDLLEGDRGYEDKTFYVKLVCSLISDSPILQVIVPKDYTEEFAEKLLLNTPVSNIYDRDLLKLSIEKRTKKYYAILFRMYGKNFDTLNMAIRKAIYDTSLYLCTDEALYDNFGAAFGWEKPEGMDFLLYRYVLQGVYQSIKDQGTPQSIIEIVKRFTGVSPDIIPYNSLINFICVDNQGDDKVSFIKDSIGDLYIISRAVAGFGIKIKVNNNGNFVVGLPSLEYLLNKFIPCHIYSSIRT